MLTTLVLVGLTGGCVSLDTGPDIQRSAAEVERAVGIPAEFLLHDVATAAETTEELLADGLTDGEAVQVALLNNPNVRAAMLSIGVSRAEFVQSALYSNPTLFLSLRFPDSGGLPDFEVNLAQNIAELWLVPARQEAAQRDLDRVVLEAARSTALVVLDVRQAYVRAALAPLRVELAADGVESATQLVEIAELRQQAGSGSEVDLNLARATKLQAVADLRNARLAAVEANAARCVNCSA
ncbi:MAG: TolC family protein [Phycisphaerales bacterium]|nr:TolC family protein [Phycisphaerales bacterium]